MNAVLWIFLALAFGFMGFVALQPELPEGASFLKNLGGPQSNVNAVLADGNYEIKGWHVIKQGDAIEFSRALDPLTQNYKFKAPVFYMICQKGLEDVRIATDEPLISQNGKTTNVLVGGMKRSLRWEVGPNNNYFPAPPQKLLEHLRTGFIDVQFQFETQSAGPINYKLDTSAMKDLSAYKVNCRKHP